MEEPGSKKGAFEILEDIRNLDPHNPTHHGRFRTGVKLLMKRTIDPESVYRAHDIVAGMAARMDLRAEQCVRDCIGYINSFMEGSSEASNVIPLPEQQPAPAA